MLAEGQPRGLIDSTGAMPRDEFGNIIAQGAGDPAAASWARGEQPAADPAATSGVTNRPNAVEPNGCTTALRQRPQPRTRRQAPAPKVTGRWSAEANPSASAEVARKARAGGATAPTPGVASPTSNDQSIWARSSTWSKASRPGSGCHQGGELVPVRRLLEGTTAEQRPGLRRRQAEQNLAAANLALTQDAILQRRVAQHEPANPGSDVEFAARADQQKREAPLLGGRRDALRSMSGMTKGAAFVMAYG